MAVVRWCEKEEDGVENGGCKTTVPMETPEMNVASKGNVSFDQFRTELK